MLRRAKPKMKMRSKMRILRKKVCKFCVEKIENVDYKDAETLRKFTTERGKMIPRRVTGACAYHQRKINTAIKRARYAALMPFLES